MDGGRAEDGIIWRGNNYGMVQGLLYYSRLEVPIIVEYRMATLESLVSLPRKMASTIGTYSPNTTVILFLMTLQEIA